jgi:hypothetical protein
MTTSRPSASVTKKVRLNIPCMGGLSTRLEALPRCSNTLLDTLDLFRWRIEQLGEVIVGGNGRHDAR